MSGCLLNDPFTSSSVLVELNCLTCHFDGLASACSTVVVGLPHISWGFFADCVHLQVSIAFGGRLHTWQHPEHLLGQLVDPVWHGEHTTAATCLLLPFVAGPPTMFQSR